MDSKYQMLTGTMPTKVLSRPDILTKKTQKNTWLECQGYSFEKNPATLLTTEIDRRKELVKESAECAFYGKFAADLITCDRYLLSGVTLRVALRRSIDDLFIMTDDAAKRYKAEALEANLYVRKMTLNYHVMSPFETTLLSSAASYPYFETITKPFLASADPHSWKQEDIFSREPIRRLATCLNTNEAFLGNNRLNPFHYRKVGLEQIYIYRNGLPVADSPISTDDDKRLYFNTISDLYLILTTVMELNCASILAISFWFLTNQHATGFPWVYSPRADKQFKNRGTEVFSGSSKQHRNFYNFEKKFQNSLWLYWYQVLWNSI